MSTQEYFDKRNQAISTAAGRGKKAVFEWVVANIGWHLLKKNKPVFHIWNKGAQFFVFRLSDNTQIANRTGLHNLEDFLISVEKEAGAWE